MYRPLSTSLRIDSEKAKKYFAEHPYNRSEIAFKAGVSPSYIRQAINHGYTNKVYWWAVCDVIGVPRDFFDYHEPEPVPEPEPEETKEPEECLINLADIQLSLNKIEALMLEQNNLLSQQNQLLRGKLEKGGSNDNKGNNGGSHAFMLRKPYEV